MNNPISPLSAAYYLCKKSGWQLTNLKLQKMLYLAQMLYMGVTDGGKLMSGSFEAWDYGPVHPDVYSLVRVFGAKPIRDVFVYGRDVDDRGRREILDSVFEAFSPLTAGQLVALTHWDDGAWAKVYRPNSSGSVIPDQLIRGEYEQRVAERTRSTERAAPEPVGQYAN